MIIRYTPLHISQMRLITTKFSLFTFTLLFSIAVHAGDRYDFAEQLARDNKIIQMTNAYQFLVNQFPQDPVARTGYARGKSWLGDHQTAQKQYQAVLAHKPDHLEAIIGLAYDLAWDKKYVQAETYFKRALALAPDSLESKKGLGYTYLWSGLYQQANSYFRELRTSFENDTEILIALAQTEIELNNNRNARKYYFSALSIDPVNITAIDGIRDINQFKPFSFNAWLGKTSHGGETGIRELELAYEFRNKFRAWGRLDNSLSLDNPALARSGESASTYYLGSQLPINKQWIGILEIGQRELPGNTDQQIFKTELIRFEKHIIKLGLQISPHSDGYSDQLVYGLYGYKYKRWLIEPGLYLATSGLTREDEWRGTLFAERYLGDGRKLGFGIGAGNIDSSIAGVSGPVTTSRIQFNHPINSNNSLGLTFRYEDSPTNNFATAMIGLQSRL